MGSPPDKQRVAAWRLWLEHAWVDWIRPLGLILLLAVGYLLYRGGLVRESLAGVLLVLAVLGGALGVALVEAVPLARLPWQRALLATIAVAGLLGTLLPPLHAALPPTVLAEGALTTAAPQLTVTTRTEGPYDVSVAGHFKEAGRSEAEASYAIQVSDGQAAKEVRGEIKRQLVTIRSRRGAASSLEEHDESTHRLTGLRGAQLTLRAEGVDDQLDGGLHVAVLKGGFDPLILLVLAAIALLLALVLDTRLVDSKGKLKSHLTVGVAIALAFSLRFPDEATSRALVRPAISAFLFALLLGGLGGWLLCTLARLLFAPRPKRAPAARR